MNNLKSKFKNLNRAQKCVWTGGIIVAVLFIFIVGKSAFAPNQLSGSYTATINAGFMTSKDTMKFDGNTVTELRKYGKDIKSTYSIDGNNITFKFNDGTVGHAKLSDDRKSFKITSAEGLAALGTGIKYTKDE
ncbi:hypothetical protein FD690_02200 [Apilactobacillus kunkeei]|uniref:hypothetical protein n=1 Tax=Apilactobacillus kunkeei TaxID=148814 RepID=UPI00110C9E4A|nr:hypothetical protein [Apilactobacillus kunkeei]TMT02152.1 hypothetical protein FD690_02200 [Apilactobacillus kunkeei]